jgi:beta-lactamase class A
MEHCRTGASRLRAGLPSGWRVADKTGTGDRGAVNDVAIVWPPEHGPLIIAAYLSDSTTAVSRLEAALAELARIAGDADWRSTRSEP